MAAQLPRKARRAGVEVAVAERAALEGDGRGVRRARGLGGDELVEGAAVGVGEGVGLGVGDGLGLGVGDGEGVGLGVGVGPPDRGTASAALPGPLAVFNLKFKLSLLVALRHWHCQWHWHCLWH